MAHFPHAFKKVFAGRQFTDTSPYLDLLRQNYCFYDAKTWAPIPVADANAITHPSVVLVMGQPYYSEDKRGPYGGYFESLKSKVIEPRSIHRFWKVNPRLAQAQIVQIGWDGIDDSTAPQFTCGESYMLRIDLKGSPALRFLGHNLYRYFNVHTACCSNPGNPEKIDPISVLLQWAQQINEDPVFSPFIKADVITFDNDGDSNPDVIDPTTYVPLTDQTEISATIGALRLTVIYTEPKIGDCAFDPLYNFENEPLVITSAQLVNADGIACPDFQQMLFTQTQEPKTAEGSGEQIVRDVILSESYNQNYYHKNARQRVINEMDLLVSTIERSSTFSYVSYYILHSMPRRSNYTGISDNDQYLIQLNVPNYSSNADFESWMANYLGSAGTGVVMEDLSDE
jgi:hypothetical protein